MLVFQTITFIWTFFIALSGLKYNSDNYEKINQLPPNTYSKEYGAFILVVIITLSALVFVLILLSQYIFLIPANVSMWEA